MSTQKPEKYFFQRILYRLCIFCIILSGILLVSCTKKEKEAENETEDILKGWEDEFEEEKPEPELLNLNQFTKLDVVTDRTKFVPTAQDQTYNKETDMNLNCFSKTQSMDVRSTDTGSVVYINAMGKNSLFAFEKNTCTAGIACNKPDCEHDMKAAKEKCQADLCVMEAKIDGMQYYNGVLYYTLTSGNATILYKTSSDHEIKSQYVMLLGEKGYGECKNWLIHRGYIYFYVEKDGIYKMSFENPADKELLINVSESSLSVQPFFAEGSYIYFSLYRNNETTLARYQTESNQFEQFTDIKEIRSFFVNNGKIYYTYWDNELGNIVYQYDTASGKNEVFLQGEDIKNFDTTFIMLHRDSDYLYIRKQITQKGDYYSEESRPEISYCIYTWDGNLAGKIWKTESDSNMRILEAFKVYHHEQVILAGSDNDRIYYIGEEYDTQVQENGVSEEVLEGTAKIQIFYIDKSEISSDADAPVHTAGEIYE